MVVVGDRIVVCLHLGSVHGVFLSVGYYVYDTLNHSEDLDIARRTRLSCFLQKRSNVKLSLPDVHAMLSSLFMSS